MTQEAKVLTGIGVVTIAIIAIAAFSFGGKSATPDKGTVLSSEQNKVVVRKDSHKMSAPGAKVTVVEFGDFQCPACGAAYPIVTQILRDYKGKVTFVFRQYPLEVHQNSKVAAEAAEAAGSQGKFFEMYDALYSNQKEWGETKNAMEYFEKYAKNIGLDVAKFKKEVQANKYAAKIQKDIADGNALGVNATPTFFINGEQQTGGLPYDEFKAKIESALKSK